MNVVIKYALGTRHRTLTLSNVVKYALGSSIGHRRRNEKTQVKTEVKTVRRRRRRAKGLCGKRKLRLAACHVLQLSSTGFGHFLTGQFE